MDPSRLEKAALEVAKWLQATGVSESGREYRVVSCGCCHVTDQARVNEAFKELVDAAKEVEMTTIPSTADERVGNNVMRHGYRPLSDAEKANMQAIKDYGLGFYQLLEQIGGGGKEAPRLASRELSLAATKIEEAVMWAVKHVTR